MYVLKRLTDISQIENIYNNYMKADFPEDELKPFSMIRKGIQKGNYKFFAYFYDDVLCGYANLVYLNNHCLLDYFAVTKADRGGGIGTRFLQELVANLSGEGVILCEAENPHLCNVETEKNTMQRRIRFYLRNGFFDTGITVCLFGVEYVILSTIESMDTEEIKTIYHNIYKQILPPILVNKNVRIH